tara:strand:- start:3646 stop:4254 length:609 start_codon:yes stop_codon:yes gene_type:complete
MGCKQKTETKPVETEPLVAEKIAKAHGFEKWENVSEIEFTFNGKRSWKWQPKTNDVTFIQDTVEVRYNRSKIDSTVTNIDRVFINDKFWLLIPFQLVWDDGVTISEPIKTEAPISKTEMHKITLLYTSDGGYTPGDAYDIYFGDDYIIKEWAFRKGNKPEAGLINTFENYQDFNGIKLALDHKKAEGDWNLKLSNIEVVLKK